MKSIINRIVTAFRVLFVRRVIVLEIHREAVLNIDGKAERDMITMWGTVDDQGVQVQILRELAKSIEYDIHKADRERVKTYEHMRDTFRYLATNIKNEKK